jgi:hypothetical protein
MLLPQPGTKWFKGVPAHLLPMPASWQGWALLGLLIVALLATPLIHDDEIAWLSRVGVMVGYVAAGFYFGGATGD